MKSLKPQIKLSVLMLALLGVTACGYSSGKSNGYYYSGNYYSKSNYEPPISKPADNYQSRSQQSQQQSTYYENPFVNVASDNTNNVSLTSSTFAYTTIREEINGNRLYNVKNMVKTEEMLNYFSYGYVNDTENALAAKLELDKCPWDNSHYLASVVVKAKPSVTENVKNNIVILVDKSGSMSPVMSLVKTSLRTLVENMGDDDIVSIVSYASGCKIECEGKTGQNKNYLNTVIDGLKASGSTNGEAGLETAYDVALEALVLVVAFGLGAAEDALEIFDVLADGVDCVVAILHPFGVLIVHRHVDIVEVVGLVRLFLEGLPDCHRLPEGLGRAVSEVTAFIGLACSREDLLDIEVDVFGEGHPLGLCFGQAACFFLAQLLIALFAVDDFVADLADVICGERFAFPKSGVDGCPNLFRLGDYERTGLALGVIGPCGAVAVELPLLGRDVEINLGSDVDFWVRMLDPNVQRDKSFGLFVEQYKCGCHNQYV